MLSMYNTQSKVGRQISRMTERYVPQLLTSGLMAEHNAEKENKTNCNMRRQNNITANIILETLDNNHDCKREMLEANKVLVIVTLKEKICAWMECGILSH